MSRLDMRHLQMLIALESAASVTDAAGRLNITPSALSHRMREAERRLGTRLFYRQASRVDLTSAAHRLLSAAKKAVAEMDRAEGEVVMAHGGFEAIVRIASRANICNTWFPRFWHFVQEREPLLSLEIVPEAAASPFEALRAGRIDLAVFTGGEPGGLHTIPLFEDELVAVVSADQPLADRPFLTGREFVDMTFATYGLDVEPDLEYDLLFSKRGEWPAKMLNLGTADAILEFLRHNAGLTVLPRAAINTTALQGLAILPLTEDGLRTTWCCAVHKTLSNNAPQQRIAEYLPDWCAREFSAPC